MVHILMHLEQQMKPGRSSGLTFRNFYVLSYAQYLHADAALWRITVAYMYSCGKIGAKTADEVLVRVPLRLRGVGSTNATESNADENTSKGDLSGIIKDLNATCHEYERENARRSICRVGSYLLHLQLIIHLPLLGADCCPNICAEKGIWSCAVILFIGGRLAGPWPSG